MAGVIALLGSIVILWENVFKSELLHSPEFIALSVSKQKQFYNSFNNLIWIVK